MITSPKSTLLKMSLALETVSNRICDGGGDYTRYTFTYASATTMTIAGDWTGIFKKGCKIEMYNTETRYGYIVGSSYSSPNTTITVSPLNDAAGNVSTLSNAAITNVYIGSGSLLRSHPQWLNWTPVLTGFSADPGSAIYRFKVEGNTCMINVQHGSNGTSNATSFTISLPITAKTLSNYVSQRTIPFLVNNNASEQNNGIAQITSAGTSVILLRALSGTGWTASNGKRARFDIEYEI